MPSISVIVPCYNYGRFLKECLESVFAQTFRDFEVLVVDDGSEDDTREAVRNFSAARYFYQEHRGISEARNRGLREAGGEWIAFLDADDLWLPDKLEKQMAYLRTHPDCSVLFTGFENFYDGDPAELNKKVVRLLNITNRVLLPTACVRACLFRTYGGFREDFPYGEDTEWLARIRIGGEDLSHCLDEVLYRRRIHGQNVTLSYESNNKDAVMQIAAASLRSARNFRKSREEKK
ncbi:glycosyltransferase family 2 protein [Papillibacter cinnamivorans]|nr:glycosyltransferase [Papillibacter cinnamivorans]